MLDAEDVASTYKDSQLWAERTKRRMRADSQAIALLRRAGCKCNLPLLGYRPKVGPRCRLCNTVALATHKAMCECGEYQYGLFEDGHLDAGWCDKLKRIAKLDHSNCGVCNDDKGRH